MSQLDEIQKQIDELIKQKNDLLVQQKAPVIAEILKKMKDYGITGEELGFKIARNRRNKSTASTVAAKYRGPNNEEWTGRGRKPLWIQAIETNGGKVEDYLIAKAE